MRLTSISLAAALALAAGASFAQPASTPPAAGAHAGHMMQRPDPAQMAERHAQHLRDALQLRPDQEPALRALVASMGPPPGGMERMGKDHDAMQGLTTPQRLDRMQARMAEHQQRFQAHIEAMKRFYAQLTPAQQKAFDAMPMMGMREHGMHGGMGHMGGRHGTPGRHDGHPHGPPPPAGH
jgi:periplasmic protein CpxP/Spy